MNWKANLNWAEAKERACILTNIRTFFSERDVIEVETPLLSHGTVTDVHLETFTTEFNYSQDSHCSESESLYLQTSPEFAMKRLLASGFGSCYQICKAFRHEYSGRNHNPEFTLLEWYRIGFTHYDLMDEVTDLLQAVLSCKEPDKLTYQTVFLKYLNIDPLETNLSAMKRALETSNVQGAWIEQEQDIDILLQVAFTECIEPVIGNNSPCFIYDFPKSQASLSQISKNDPRVAERFECYYQGVELANGFNELTDAKEQMQRFSEDNAKRQLLNKTVKPIDQNFISALTDGIPQCSGVALGIDRLLMLALKKESIHSTMTFSIENA